MHSSVLLDQKKLHFSIIVLLFLVNWTNAAADIDECALDTHNCHMNANCTNTNGSFTCACNKSFTGNGVNCTDINECVSDTHNCHMNANCTNTNGSFTCACNKGFTGNGVNCTDIDECANKPACDKNAKCYNLPGNYSCTCDNGYTGNGTNCTDIDECSNKPCDRNAKCSNLPGNYICTCNGGYTGNGINCTDIDDCTVMSSVCHQSTVCENTVGSYECKCRSGTVMVGDVCKAVKTFTGRLSIISLQYLQIYNDTNSSEYKELRDELKDAIKQLYENTSYGEFVVDVVINKIYNGSVRVDYDIIFNSTAANLTTALLNTELEKAVKNANGTIGTIGSNSLILGPVNGTRFFILNDKDECKSDKPCDENAACNNIDGSFSCTCHSGFSGDGFNCADNNECFSAPCDRNGFCTNTPGSYNCSCNKGLIGDGLKCGGVNCSALVCERNESCVLLGDLYYCSLTKNDTEDNSNVLSSGEFAAAVVLPTVAFVLLLIIVFVIYKKRIDKIGQEKYAAEEGHYEYNSSQQNTQM